MGAAPDSALVERPSVLEHLRLLLVRERACIPGAHNGMRPAGRAEVDPVVHVVDVLAGLPALRRARLETALNPALDARLLASPGRQIDADDVALRGLERADSRRLGHPGGPHGRRDGPDEKNEGDCCENSLHGRNVTGSFPKYKGASARPAPARLWTRVRGRSSFRTDALPPRVRPDVRARLRR